MTNSSPSILVVGSNGQLGKALSATANTRAMTLIACTREMLDITNSETITRAIKQFKPDLLINAAAYTAVDKAESDINACMRINHQGAQHLALACQHHGIPLIHISTDYVFDGLQSTPYREDDHINPLNVYGNSKWLGEQAIREHCEQHLILRVSGIFSEYGHNFLKTILRLAAEKNELSIVSDQFTCPTYAGHIAEVLLTLANTLSHWGTYHYCDTPPTSWYEFTRAIIQQAQALEQALTVTTIKPIKAIEYPTPALRPDYSVLDCNKIKHDYGISQANWAASLTNVITRLSNGI